MGKINDNQNFKIEKQNGEQNVYAVPVPPAENARPRHVNRKPSFFVEEGNLVLPLKIIGSDNEEILPEDIVEPPDGGWGWIVVFASFIHNFVFGGTLFSFGVMLDAISDQLSTNANAGGGNQISVTKIAWVGAILVACNRFTGPFAAALVNKFGFRSVTIVGSLIACLGLVASWFFSKDGVPNIEALFICYGVVTGIGIGCIAMTSVIIIGFYFDKKRALATGISVCGSGVGTCVFPVMLGCLIKQYGWPMALLFKAGLFLACVGPAILYKPLVSANHSLAKRVQEEFNEGSSDSSQNEDVIENSSEITNGVEFSTQMQMFKTPVIENTRRPKFIRMKSLGYMGPGMKNCSSSGTRMPENSMLRRRISLAVPPISSSMDDQTPRILIVKDKRIFNRPMSRDNIFYSGSIRQIKELPEDFTHMDLAFANSKFEEDLNKEIVPIESKSQNKAWKEKLSVVVNMLSFDLMRSLTFNLLLLMCGLAAFGLFVPYVYLIGLAQEKGTNSKDATFLISVIGISDMIGRLISGFVGGKVGNHVVFINNGALMIGGLATMLVPCFSSYTSLIIYACIFGLANATVVSLRSIILVDLIGLSKLTNAFGLTLFVEGIATLFGSPFAGFLHDWTGNYSVSFYVAGAFMLLSGIVCTPVYNVQIWEDRKKDQDTKV